MQHFSIKKLANINLMQANIESLIRFVLTFLNWSRPICGRTILSLVKTAGAVVAFLRFWHHLQMLSLFYLLNLIYLQQVSKCQFTECDYVNSSNALMLQMSDFSAIKIVWSQ